MQIHKHSALNQNSPFGKIFPLFSIISSNSWRKRRRRRKEAAKFPRACRSFLLCCAESVCHFLFVCLSVCVDLQHFFLLLFAAVVLKAQLVMSLLPHHQRDPTPPEGEEEVTTGTMAYMDREAIGIKFVSRFRMKFIFK